MAKCAQSRADTLTTPVNRAPTFDAADLRRIATAMPETLPDAAALARRFFPRSSLARAV